MHTVKRLSKKRIIEGTLKHVTSNSIVWVDYLRPTKEELAELSLFIGISANDIEDYLDETTRPSVNEIGKYSVIILKAPILEGSEMLTTPLVVIISKYNNDFITIHNQQFGSIYRLSTMNEEKMTAMFEKGPTFMFYRLVVEMLNSYFDRMNIIADNMEKVEDQIFESKNKSLMKEIFLIKKTLIYFYKSLIANRDVISSIEKEYISFFTKEDLKKFRSLYADLSQLIDLSLTYRDILASSVEVHLSTVSNDLNITMKKLSGWAAIILVPSLIAGFYGMNLEYLPFAHNDYSYLIIIGIMLFSIIVLYAYFKSKDWI